MSIERSGPGATTVVAAMLIFVETAFWIFAGGAMLLAAVLLGRKGGDESVPFIPITTGAVRGIFAVIGTVILLLCAAAIVAGIGILRRRAWARWIGLALFAVFGLMVLAAIVGPGDNPEAVGMAMSSLFFLCDAAIVTLLALPATGRDFRPVPLTAPVESQGPSTPLSS